MSKYGVISGRNRGKYGPEIIPCLETFDAVSNFGSSTTFIHFNWCPLWVSYGVRCVHFTVTRGRGGRHYCLLFQFVFGFNQCLWAIFSILSFKKIKFYIWVLVVWLLILRHKWLYVILIPMPINKKTERKDHQIYFRMSRKIFKKEV